MSTTAGEPGGWYELLQELYRKAGRPTVRAIAQQAGTGASTAHSVISGSHLPHRSTLVAVAAALTDDTERIGQLMEAFDNRLTETPPRLLGQGEGLVTPELVAAVDRLTAAITRVGDLMEKALFAGEKPG